MLLTETAFDDNYDMGAGSTDAYHVKQALKEDVIDKFAYRKTGSMNEGGAPERITKRENDD